MYLSKKQQLDTSDLFLDFSYDLAEMAEAESSEQEVDVISFIKNEVQLGEGFTLTPAQLLIPKLVYGLPLDDTDLKILSNWQRRNQTTWDNSKAKRPQVLVLEAGRRSGKCGDFLGLVNSRENGLQYYYEQIIGDQMGIDQRALLHNKEKGAQVFEEFLVTSGINKGESVAIEMEVAIEGKERRAKASHFFNKGLSKTKLITTACGYFINATPEHRVKVMDESGNIVWRYLEDIKLGEYICIHRSTQLFTEKEVYIDKYIPTMSVNAKLDTQYPNTFNADWAYLIGLAVANGTWNVSDNVQITCHIQDVESYIKAFDNCGIKTYTAVQRRIDAKAMTLFVYRKELRQFLANLGWVDTCNVNTKCTPWSVRRSPKQVQAAYLSGLFDGDGSVEAKGKVISLSSASKQLATETQLLLLNFGIVSRVKEKMVNNRPYYILTLRGRRSVQVFINEIGFKLERKQSQVVANLSATEKDGSDTERIPYQKVWLQRLRDQLPNNMGMQPNSKMALTSYQGQSLPKLENLRLKLRSIVGNAIKTSCAELLSSYRLQNLISFIEQYCTDLEILDHFKYIQDCDYFYDPVVSVEDSEAYCVDLTVPGYEEYVAQGMTNHNTTICSILAAYEFFCLSRLSSPQAYYKLASSTPIGILILATTAQQAKTSIFRQVAMVIKNSKYFSSLIAKKKLFVGKEEIAYEEKGIYIQSGNSKSASQVGGTLKTMIMDEVARFTSEDGDSNAMTLWSNLGISCAPFKEKALRIAISSAWEEKDAIEILYESTESSPYSIGIRVPSWELNTNISRDNPVVAYEYSMDPVGAALEFEGIRPSAQNSFLEASLIDKAITGITTVLASSYIDENSKLVCLTIDRIQPRKEQDTILHIDPGLKRDSYALAYGHAEYIDSKFIVFIDGLLLWEPRYNAEVSLLDVGEKIKLIHKQRPLLQVTADHYNSAETLQRLRQEGIRAESLFFSNRQQLTMYSALRSLLAEGRVVLPKDNLWTPMLVTELKRVQLKNNTKIDHPPKESKDLADAVASVVYHLNKKAALVNQGAAPITVTKETSENQNARSIALDKLAQRRGWSRQALKDSRKSF